MGSLRDPEPAWLRARPVGVAHALHAHLWWYGPPVDAFDDDDLPHALDLVPASLTLPVKSFPNTAAFDRRGSKEARAKVIENPPRRQKPPAPPDRRGCLI